MTTGDSLARLPAVVPQALSLSQSEWRLALPRLTLPPSQLGVFTSMQALLWKYILHILSFFSATMKLVSFFHPSRLFDSVPESEAEIDAWAERFWNARIEEAKFMVQVIGVLITGVLMRYTSGEGWPILDGLLQLSFTVLAVSLVIQCVSVLCSISMQDPSRRQRWVEDVRARTPVTYGLSPWIGLTIPTAWTFCGIAIVCITMLVSTWTPPPRAGANVPAEHSQHFYPILAVAMTVVLLQGGLCVLVLIMTYRRWLSYGNDSIQVV